MTPFEVALAIREKPDDDEDIADFMLRTMPDVSMGNFAAAIDLLNGWDRADEDMRKLVELLLTVGEDNNNIPLVELLKIKRGLGYDAALETLLARRWRCPHCKQFATIEKVALPVGYPSRLPSCVICGEEGIAPVQPEAHLSALAGGKA